MKNAEEDDNHNDDKQQTVNLKTKRVMLAELRPETNATTTALLQATCSH